MTTEHTKTLAFSTINVTKYRLFMISPNGCKTDITKDSPGELLESFNRSYSDNYSVVKILETSVQKLVEIHTY